MRRRARLVAAFLAALAAGGIGAAWAQGEVDSLVDTFNRGGWVDSGQSIVTGPLAEAVDRVGTRACFRIGDSPSGGAGRCRCVASIGRVEGPQGKALSLSFGEEHECGQRPAGGQDRQAALQELVGSYSLRVVRQNGGCSGAEVEGSFAVTSVTENAIALSLNGTSARGGFNWQERSFRARLSEGGVDVDLSGRFTRAERSIDLTLDIGLNLAGRCTITLAGSRPAEELAAAPASAAPAPAPAPSSANGSGGEGPGPDEGGPISETIGEWLDWLDGLEGSLTIFLMSLGLGLGAGLASRPKTPRQSEEGARLKASAKSVRRLAQQIRNGPVSITMDQWDSMRALARTHGVNLSLWEVYADEWGMEALASDLDVLAQRIEERIASS